MQNWTHKDNINRGLVNQLSAFLEEYEYKNKIYFPDFSKSKKLFLFSDYSGDLKESNLISYSILIIDEKSFQSFLSSHKIFWKEKNLENRIIDYKGLNDKIKSNALVPFLQYCNNLNGLILTIVISKELKSIFLTEKPENIKQKLVPWGSTHTQEKLLRIRDFILLVLNGLGKSGQDILWVTDNDNIVANKRQLETGNEFIKQTLLKHLDYQFGGFSLITLSDDSEERALEKLCSLPDLVAGTLVDFIGDYNLESINLSEGEICAPIEHKKRKVNPITNWLSKNEELFNLKKVNITIKKG